VSRRSWPFALAALVAVQVTLLVVYQRVERAHDHGHMVTMERRSEPGHDIEVEQSDGSRLVVPARSGRYQLVHFWATWCPPCVREMPSLSQLARRDPERLRVWAVSTDQGWDSVDRFFRNDIPDHVVRDPTGAGYRAYMVSGLPDSYLVGPEGRVVARFAGGQDWQGAGMERVLSELMGAGLSGR
jgi:thiol-disulfide isomerase/thioredoxin